MTDPHMAGQRRENNQCEDCGDDIGLFDVQGHYDGKCAKCRGVDDYGIGDDVQHE